MGKLHVLLHRVLSKWRVPLRIYNLLQWLLRVPPLLHLWLDLLNGVLVGSELHLWNMWAGLEGLHRLLDRNLLKRLHVPQQLHMRDLLQAPRNSRGMAPRSQAARSRGVDQCLPLRWPQLSAGGSCGPVVPWSRRLRLVGCWGGKGFFMRRPA